MIQVNHYLIRLSGQVDVTELNPASPQKMTLAGMETNATLLSICTDQSGLIGLLRHLHNLGFALVSIERQTETSIDL